MWSSHQKIHQVNRLFFVDTIWAESNQHQKSNLSQKSNVKQWDVNKRKVHFIFILDHSRIFDFDELKVKLFILDDKATEAAERKKYFEELDAARKKTEGLNDLEEEAKKENEYLLEKARVAKIEQEDKIKQLNELILDAKVHAIRDLQINEKSEIKADEEDEDKRLDVIMEVHRLNGMRQAERIEQEKIIQRREGARQILSQIQSNTEARLLEEEKKNAEAQALVE